MKKSKLIELAGWFVITLMFLFERRYLAEKAGLPNFFVCVLVRMLLLFGLVTVARLIARRFWKASRHFTFSVLLLLALSFYIALQSLYDVYLFGYVIGDERFHNFLLTLPFNLLSTVWYIFVIACIQLAAKTFFVENKLQPIPDDLTEIYLKSGLKTIKTPLDSVLYVQALKDYSIVFTSNGKVVTKGTLKFMESILPQGKFMRVHKSYIVSKQMITAVERNKIFLSQGVVIPVGRSFQDKLSGF